MRVAKYLIGMSVAALMAGSALAADPSVKVGASVFDTSGGTVGTIEAVNGDLVVVNTGTNKASLPSSAFAKGDKGPIIGMTKAQLDEAAAGAQAKADADLKAKLVSGASVYGSGGEVAGTVDSADAEFVTLNVGTQKVKLPINSIASGEKGLTIAMTAEQLRQAAAGAAPAASTAAATAETPQP